MAKLGVAFLTWKRYSQKGIAHHNITLKQYYVLRQLKPNVPLQPSQVADMLFCDRPTATVIVRNMERQGWIRRTKDPDNGKCVLIYSTEKGLQKLSIIDAEMGKNKSKAFDPLGCFTKEEREMLDILLAKLNNHLANI